LLGRRKLSQGIVDPCASNREAEPDRFFFGVEFPAEIIELVVVKSVVIAPGDRAIGKPPVRFGVIRGLETIVRRPSLC
jgi:hypothetical protein